MNNYLAKYLDDAFKDEECAIATGLLEGQKYKNNRFRLYFNNDAGDFRWSLDIGGGFWLNSFDSLQEAMTWLVRMDLSDRTDIVPVIRERLGGLLNISVTTVEILSKWLVDNKYDGLRSPDGDCGCILDSLCFLSKGQCLECSPAHKVPNTEGDFDMLTDYELVELKLEGAKDVR